MKRNLHTNQGHTSDWHGARVSSKYRNNYDQIFRKKDMVDTVLEAIDAVLNDTNATIAKKIRAAHEVLDQVDYAKCAEEDQEHRQKPQYGVTIDGTNRRYRLVNNTCPVCDGFMVYTGVGLRTCERCGHKR